MPQIIKGTEQRKVLSKLHGSAKTLIKLLIVAAFMLTKKTNEPVHEISNNVVCATSKASDQPAHTRSLIRAFASRFSIL